MARTTLSVVVPVFNEQEVLPTFHDRLIKTLGGLDLRAEIIYVNDGSADDSRIILEAFRSLDERVGVLELSRNFGKEAALSAGLENSTGDAVVVIDADLQDPPELIEDFVRVWQVEHVDVVYGTRTGREGESWLKKLTANLFYRAMQQVGTVKIPRDSGDFRLLDRRAIEALKQFPERNRFMKGLFAWIGFDQRALPYQRDARYAGRTKWNYWRLWNLALDGITSYTVTPLKLASYVGLSIALVAFVYMFVIVAKTILYGDPVAGYPSLMAVVLFLGGIQLTFIGILGEYLGRVFTETKVRPLYLVKTFDAPTAHAVTHDADERGDR